MELPFMAEKNALEQELMAIHNTYIETYRSLSWLDNEVLVYREKEMMKKAESDRQLKRMQKRLRERQRLQDLRGNTDDLDHLFQDDVSDESSSASLNDSAIGSPIRAGETPYGNWDNLDQRQDLDNRNLGNGLKRSRRPSSRRNNGPLEHNFDSGNSMERNFRPSQSLESDRRSQLQSLSSSSLHDLGRSQLDSRSPGGSLGSSAGSDNENSELSMGFDDDSMGSHF